MADDGKKGFATRVVHAGHEPEPVTGSLMPPIFATSTYAQIAPGEGRAGHEYGRSQNPTRAAWERCVADLESARHGFAFASGMAAIATVLELVEGGGHVLCGDDVYGGSYRLFEQVRRRSAGLEFSYVDLADLDAVAAAIRPATRMLWIETPTNPMLRIADLDALAALARTHGMISVVDNTFATPFNQRPVERGIDVVVHSATKYLGGHSDVVGGVAVTVDDELGARLSFLHKSVGAIAGPFDSYLALRGVKTLALRMARHNANGLAVATWLEAHPGVERVLYPGLASHPQADLAGRQMRGFSGMVSAILRGGRETTLRFLQGVRVFALAESLGGVESLIGHPASMSHASMPLERREAAGIFDNLVRLSVGIEETDDLIEDLRMALDRAAG